MNPTSTKPDTDEITRLEKLRTQLSTDIEAMQLKEASLREYEQKLRLLVENASNSQTAQTADQKYVTSGREALDTEWEKYERAHALMEAARRSLTDDRLALKEREDKVMSREQEVARREAWLKGREQQAAKADADAVAAAAAAAAKPKSSFTTAPFLAAKNLLSLGKNQNH